MLGQPPASHGEAERARSRAKVTLSRFFLCPTSFVRIVSGAPAGGSTAPGSGSFVIVAGVLVALLKSPAPAQGAPQQTSSQDWSTFFRKYRIWAIAYFLSMAMIFFGLRTPGVRGLGPTPSRSATDKPGSLSALS